MRPIAFDDELDKLYRRHDGGQDTVKGVLKASDYVDYERIPDKQAAGLLVSLDVFRGVGPEEPEAAAPQEGPGGRGGMPKGPECFYFEPDRLLAESAFQRMLEKACGTPRAEVFKIQRSEGGLTCARAVEMLNAALSPAMALPAGSDQPLCRADAVDLLVRALKASDGSGRLPKLVIFNETTELSHLEEPQNTRFVGPDGTLLTVTVNGEFQPLVGGWSYDGKVVVTVSERYDMYRYFTEPTQPGMPPEMAAGMKKENALWNDFDEPYRAALFIQDGKKVPSRSIDAAYGKGENGGAYICSSDAPSDAFGMNNFNGVIVTGKGTKYEIDDLTVRFNGNGCDDFQGMGAGILCTGDETETIIDNADVFNYGTVRSALVAGGSARVLVKNSLLQTHEGILEEGWIGGMGAAKMRAAPNMGGFEGNCRSNNLLDQAEVSYWRTRIMAEKWGVLSTDNNKGVRYNVVNSFVGITGGLNEAVDTSSEPAARMTLSQIPFDQLYGEVTRDLGPNPYHPRPHAAGYGTYSIGNTKVTFAGSTIVTADYGATCVNEAASVEYCSSKPERLAAMYGIPGLEVEEKNTVLYCDKSGIMFQRGNGKGSAIIRDKTVFHCGCHCFAIKSNGSFNIQVDDSTLISEMGTILQLMDDDDLHTDPIVEPAMPTDAEREAAAALAASGKWDLFHAREGRDVFVTYSNMTINGDSFNSCGYAGLITEQDLETNMPGPGGLAMRNNPKDSARMLEITLKNVCYNGAISTAFGRHIDRDTGLFMPQIDPLEKWYCLSVLQSQPAKPYQAGLILKLEEGSVWNVDKTCWLTSLTISKDSVIHGSIFLNGEAILPEPGKTYEGCISVHPA